MKNTTKQRNDSCMVQFGLLAALGLAAAVAATWPQLHAARAINTKTAVDVYDNNNGNFFTITENGDGTATVDLGGAYTDASTGETMAFNAHHSAYTNYSINADPQLDRFTHPEPASCIATVTVNATLSDLDTGETPPPAVLQVVLVVDNGANSPTL